MPDYGDVVDAEFEEKEELKVKEHPDEPLTKSEPRPEALHLTGAQRLNRAHLSEIFASKSLPDFDTLEWIDDARVVCVFASAKEASIALQGAEDGFGDTMAEAKTAPGPGLWRAQRDMIDFREATVADAPDAGFKKWHRGGKQVREFRFWEAIKEVDKNILEPDRGEKRAMPDGIMEPRGKRRKTEGNSKSEGGDENDEGNLLEMMAAQDKNMFSAKEEANEREHESWRERTDWRNSGTRGRGGGRDDDWYDDGSADDYGSFSRQRRGGGERQSWYDDRDHGGGKGKGRKGKGPPQTAADKRRNANDGSSRNRNARVAAPDDEERARRSKRSERFNL